MSGKPGRKVTQEDRARVMEEDHAEFVQSNIKSGLAGIGNDHYARIQFDGLRRRTEGYAQRTLGKTDAQIRLMIARRRRLWINTRRAAARDTNGAG